MAQKTRNLFCISFAMLGALVVSHLFASNALPGSRLFPSTYASARTVETVPDFGPTDLREVRREAPAEMRALSLLDHSTCAGHEGIASGRCEPERIALFTRARDYRSSPQDGSSTSPNGADRTPMRAPRACPKIPVGSKGFVDSEWLVELGVCDPGGN